MWYKPLIGLIAGGVFGYLYYRLVGCPTGGCPLTSNPYSSVLIWAALGAAVMIGK